MKSLYNSVQTQLKVIYERQKWNEYSPFVDVNFLVEELGEVAECIFNLKADHLLEEIGDVFSTLFALGNRYNLQLNPMRKDDNVTLSTSDMMVKLQMQAGLVAREIRRREIGRHAHKETMTVEQMDKKLKTHLHQCMNSLIDISSVYGFNLTDIFEYHLSKLNKLY